MPISDQDKTVLRKLAEQQARIAALPIHAETAGQWRRMNALTPGRPMVWINEICWHQMDVDDELTCLCADPWARGVEYGLRRTLYQWRHLPVNMVVDDRLYCNATIGGRDFGISEDCDIRRADGEQGIISREFHSQINTEADIEKIQFAKITYDADAHERKAEEMREIFGDIIAVEKRGVPGEWFAPWDNLIRWWTVEQGMMDLIDKPDLVRAAMDRLVSAYLDRMDQYEKLNLLSLNSGNKRVGSGGPGFSDELPAEGFDPNHVRPIDQWGCATAQIFSEVSPTMHEEFALRYERRWLKHFGMTYYGCCEPLHLKLGILESVPNLRKISMSPWADLDVAAPLMTGKYVISHKPNPAVLATDDWNPEQARTNLREVLDKTKGCAVEIILKDISTVRNQPQRLWEWSRIAMEEADRAG